MTTEVGATAAAASKPQISPAIRRGPPATPTVGRGAPVATQHRDQRQGLADHGRRPGRVDRRHEAIRPGATADRSGRYRDPAPDRPIADRVADRRVRSRQPVRVRLGHHRARDRLAHRVDGVPAVAAPVHLRRQCARPRVAGRRDLRMGLPPAPVRRHRDRAVAGVLVPVSAGRGGDDHRRRDRLLDGRSGAPASDRQGDRDRRDRRARRRAALSRGRPPLRHRRRDRGRRRAPAQHVPLLRAQRGVPGRVPAREDRAPRRGRAPGSSDSRSDPAAARVHGARSQTRRARGVGWVDAAAPPRRGRPGYLLVRQVVRDEPCARRPLVQDRSHDPLRTPGGRGAVPVGAPAGAVRGLHASAHARLRHPDRGAGGHRRAHAGARVPPGRRSSSTARRRSATPRSTTP